MPFVKSLFGQIPETDLHRATRAFTGLLMLIVIVGILNPSILLLHFARILQCRYGPGDSEFPLVYVIEEVGTAVALDVCSRCY